MHGKKFYNFDYECAGIVTDEPLTRRGFYTCYHPAKQIFRRYSSKKIEEFYYRSLENTEYGHMIKNEIGDSVVITKPNRENPNEIIVREIVINSPQLTSCEVKDNYIYFSVLEGGKK